MVQKALLIGINYVGTKSELRGCVNDVVNVKRFLMEHKSFKDDQIRMMTEASDHVHNQPTRANIIAAIKELVKDNTSESRLFLHYSGHGGWRYDYNREETDGRDETICPVDYAKSGVIVDDELHRILVNSLVEGAKLFCLFDCCHSGTVLDLKYNYKVSMEPNQNKYTINTVKKYRPTSGTVVTISGCKDDQTSADAYLQKRFQGALTCCFLQSYKELKEQSKPITYKRMMKRILIKCRTGNFTQIPQLCSGNFINLSEEFPIC